MVFREAFATEDFCGLRKRGERSHEIKRLVRLIERLNQQLADQEKRGALVVASKPQSDLSEVAVSRYASRSSAFER